MKSSNISQLLINKITCKKSANDYSEIEWELLLRQARAAGLTARLDVYSKYFSLFEVPYYVKLHLDSAEKFWFSQERVVKWELHCLSQAFRQMNLPLILLKGAAYSASGVNAKSGRLFNDIDLMVPKERLQEVQDALKIYGWFPENLDEYDKSYYERWMHELPPLRHIKRGTVLDIHHNILPHTCKISPKAELLLADVVKIPNTEYWTLSSCDMVLHSASHLFWGGEFDNGLRDLTDIDLLMRECNEHHVGFFEELVSRAEFLGLEKPLFYALRYSKMILQTPVPDSTIEYFARYSYLRIKVQLMDFLFIRALMPEHSSCEDQWTGLARWLLYIRSHWLRMPVQLLIPHLIRKGWIRLLGNENH